MTKLSDSPDIDLILCKNLVLLNGNLRVTTFTIIIVPFSSQFHDSQILAKPPKSPPTDIWPVRCNIGGSPCHSSYLN